jgi:hypothetical protein
MKSKSTVDHRLAFSERLKSALESAAVPATPTELSRHFNHRSGENKVTVHAARKWLIGEAIPTQSKIVLLASWLQVSPAWLRFGEPEGAISRDTLGSQPGQLPRSALVLIHDILDLPEAMQIVVRDLVNSLSRNFLK